MRDIDAFAVEQSQADAPTAPPPPPAGTTFKLTVKNQAGTVTHGDVTYTVLAGDGYTDIVNGLDTLLTAAPGMAGFAITAVSADKKVRIEHNTDFQFSAWLPVSVAVLTVLQRSQEHRPFAKQL
jgi:hypothetical protein